MWSLLLPQTSGFDDILPPSCTVVIPPDGQAEDARGKSPDFTSMFRGLVVDADRSLVSANGSGLPLAPFPIAQDPPPPVSEERKQEILNDPRVKAQQQSATDGKPAEEEDEES